MFILLMGIFFFFVGTYLIKEMQIVSFLRQPPLSSCERTRSIYLEEELLSLAFQEFVELRKHYEADTIDINNAISRNGALFCFCEEAITNKGDAYDQVYELPYSTTNIHDIDSYEYYQAPICELYYSYMTSWGYVLEMVFSYSIVVASFVIREFFIWIASKIHFKSLSSETMAIMLSVFFITYINYGLIQLFASIDMRHAKIPFITTIFNGLYPDFNALWYNDIGVLIYAIMFSNMYWPVLEYFLFVGIRWFNRCWD